MSARAIALLIAVVLLTVWLAHPSRHPAGDRIGATITHVVDGDTIDVRTDAGKPVRVRLLGIDTPETKRPGTPIECGGPEATRSMQALAAPGHRITLQADPTQDRVDRYGRLLAYADLDRHDSLEDAQLRAGWAAPYVYAGRPVERYARFAREAAAARAARRGVWGGCGGDFHVAAAQPVPRFQP